MMALGTGSVESFDGGTLLLPNVREIWCILDQRLHGEMLRMRYWILAGGLLLSGCIPGTIAKQYSEFSGCAQGDIVVKRKGRSKKWESYRASGCGNGARFVCRNQTDCRSPQLIVARRHGRQFGCPPQHVKVRALGQDAYLVVGCGQELTYQCFDDSEHVVRCIAETARRGY